MSETTLVKLPHCWKSHVTAHISIDADASFYFSRSNYMYHFVIVNVKIKIFKLIEKNEKIIQLKDKDYCPIEIIKGLTDKGQFQHLIKLMGPQEGTYLYATQFHSLR